jgi:exodeoxyribonuclease-3
MKIATFNVNSIRSRVDILKLWLAENRPNILCVQETKVQDSEFPIDELANLGYHIIFAGQKKYNGVAIFSDQPPQNVESFLAADEEKEARFLKMSYNNIKIINTYIPQGQSTDSDKFQYKLKWFSDLLAYFRKTCRPDQPILWVGDLNVARDERDVFEPEKHWGDVCYCQELQDAMNKVIDWGFVDVFRQFHPEPELYSFWDYRIPNGFKRNLGWRLDYIMATAPLAEKCKDCRIEKSLRGLEKPSDHVPVIAEFKK